MFVLCLTTILCKAMRARSVILCARIVAFSTLCLAATCSPSETNTPANQTNPSQSTIATNKVLAQVNDRKITAQDFTNQIAGIPSSLQPFVKAQKSRFLRGLVEEELLFQEGQKQKFGESADVLKQLEQVKRKLVVQKLIQDQIKSKIQKAMAQDILSKL
jgi:hypothetical protein